jgi:UTP--glucose-1-phosphate uridylyltransferase
MATSLTKVTKAVFPVAGFGTRFLPATKANPKEMLPIVDKPLIQYAVEEAIAAGITELIFVTNSSKRAIEDHFDTHYELEQWLRTKGDTPALTQVQNIVPPGVDCIYVRQPCALGLGHAILCAKQVVGDHPFAVLLADDLICAPTQSCLQQMLNVYHKTHASVVAVQRIARENSEKYGIIATDPHWYQQGPIKAIVEKPKPQEAPSSLGVVGRYILTPTIFQELLHVSPGKRGEIQLTDAIERLLLQETVTALQFEGMRYDCGTKLGYMQATIAYGLKHPDIGRQFKQYLREIVEEETEVLDILR